MAISDVKEYTHLTEDEVDVRIAELVEKPEDSDAAANLEKAIEQGGDALDGSPDEPVH